MSTLKKFKFIVFEGCEGSGKSTQFKKLKEYVPGGVFFREPGGTDLAEKVIRPLMLNSEFASLLDAFQQMNLAMTGRAQNIRDIVVPAHAEGKPVFTDRFDASTFAYQIFGMEGDHLFDHFNTSRLVMGPLAHLPSLYIILDVPVEVGMARVAKRENERKGTSNHFDTRGPDFHERVRAGYQRFAEMFGTKVKVVDATKSVDEVWSEVRAIIDEHLAS